MCNCELCRSFEAKRKAAIAYLGDRYLLATEQPRKVWPARTHVVAEPLSTLAVTVDAVDAAAVAADLDAYWNRIQPSRPKLTLVKK